MMSHECKVGLSLRVAYQAAFKNEADAERKRRPTTEQTYLRKLAQTAFEALQKCESGCSSCRGQWDA